MRSFGPAVFILLSVAACRREAPVPAPNGTAVPAAADAPVPVSGQEFQIPGLIALTAPGPKWEIKTNTGQYDYIKPVPNVVVVDPDGTGPDILVSVYPAAQIDMRENLEYNRARDASSGYKTTPVVGVSEPVERFSYTYDHPNASLKDPPGGDNGMTIFLRMPGKPDSVVLVIGTWPVWEKAGPAIRDINSVADSIRAPRR